MQLYSTNNRSTFVTFKDALLTGLAPDNGLYMPKHIPVLPKSFFQELPRYSLPEIGQRVLGSLIGDEIDEVSLKKIVTNAFDFDAPIREIDTNTYVLELFHGPSLAFKDFGARFMAFTLSHFLKSHNQKITILAATSGDTGSAVAQGFYDVSNIDVVILYPAGKVSLNQEKQLTTLGKNITPLKVDGCFDDCQRLVKTAFLDRTLKNRLNLTSANSINIGRLLPQSLYYFHAYAKVFKPGQHLIFAVPSGNFGNLCGGLLAKRMGLPIHRFIAATNINDVFPLYIEKGKYEPRPSIKTLSNAMDVGDPSNFYRILDLYSDKHEKIKSDIISMSYGDDSTIAAIKKVYEVREYFMCPHTAVAYLGLQEAMEHFSIENNRELTGVFLSTAHPAKFQDTVNDATGQLVELPARLRGIIDKPMKYKEISRKFEDFKRFLLKM